MNRLPHIVVLFSICIVGCGTAVQSTSTKSKPNSENNEASKQTADPKISSSVIDVELHAKDLKSLAEIMREVKKVGEGAESDKVKVRAALIQEVYKITERITNLDREKDKKRFEEKANKVMDVALITYAPEIFNEVNIPKTRNKLRYLDSTLKLYQLDLGTFPSEEQGLGILFEQKNGMNDPKWRGPYVETESRFTDSWGNPYVYRPTDSSFELFSLGPDGKEGTPDDIRFGEEEP